MKDFVPTHRITFTPVAGNPWVCDVMEYDGSLYARDEWENHDAADWSITGEGRVLFQGQAAPSNGVVTVERIE